MAFFLIGRGPGDDLQIVSAEFFASRQDAIAELSRLSAEPAFDRWDSEVFVMDLDAGVPVLLVRPQVSVTAESAAPVAEEVAEGTGDADAWQADLPQEFDAVAVEEPAAAMAQAQGPQPVASGEAATEEPAEEVAASEEETAPAEEKDDLRDALLRTTERMTAEGIVAPESAGLSEAQSPVEAEVAPAEESPPPAEAPAEEAPAQEAAAESSGVAAWPWDAPAEVAEEPEPGVSPDIATVYEALEEPQDVLGVGAAMEGALPEGALVEPGTAAQQPMSAGDEGATPAEEEGGQESDFILDLDAIQPVALDAGEDEEASPAKPADIAQPASADEEVAVENVYSSPLTEYTCEDCVYVETCPNRDQRAPKDCGSFQWK